MELSLLLIYEQLNLENMILKMDSPPGPCFTGTRILPRKLETAGNEKILYVDLEKLTSDSAWQAPEHLPLIASRSTHMHEIHNGIFINSETSLEKIFNAVLDIFQRFQTWSALTQKKLLQGAGLQEIFNLCGMVTPDTVYLTDSSMKMYVHSEPTLLHEISAIWRYQVSYGYMPIHIINQLMTTGEMERINSYRNAFTLDSQTFNNPYTCKNIFSDRVLKAHIFIVSLYSRPTQTHKEIAENLGTALLPYICQNPDFSSRAGQIFENFFRDLLKRRVQDSLLIQQQISIFGWKIADDYSTLAIDVKAQPQEQVQFLINYFCGLHYDCQAFENSGHIICIFHVVTDLDKKVFSEKTDRLLRKLDLKGAFSKTFTDIRNIDIYYTQVSSILRFCGRKDLEKHLFLQEDVGLYGILEAALEHHDALELCHPDILSLYEYDKQNGSAYLDTLFYYLLNGQNAVKAAKALYIHRNTMNYRLEKISELLSCDTKDDDSRLYVLISILLLRHQQELFHEDN